MGSPAEVAALVRQQVESNTLGATLVDLAVKGVLRITEALRESFYVHVPGFLALVQEAEMRKGFFRQWPETVRAWALVIGWAVTLLVVMLGVAGALLLVSLIGWAMPRRTPQGVATLRQALGFEEFLRRVEAPRYRRVIRTPELFECWLPYAMVAGLTRQWTAAFRGIVQEPPAWFSVDHEESFDVDAFGEDIEDCGRDCCEVLQSSPSSSGSDFGSSDSGSSGGGSSGGGDCGDGGGF